MSEGPGRRGVTIYDVAQHAGVSKSLVSLVLQDSPRVSPARREAVQQAIAELGYRPSRAAATLAGQRSNTIGVVVDEFSNLWFVDLLDGLRTGLSDSGFHVSVADAALNSHLRESSVQGFLSARVDGLVLAAEPAAADADGIDVPTVLVGARLRGVAGADLVSADEKLGSWAAVQHLLGLGHSRIAFITGPTGPAAARAFGYRQAMTERGLGPVEADAPDTTDRGGYTAARDLISAHPDLTAVIAANDLMALGAWQALREAGRRVPDDVSLIGYDNSPLAATGLIQLTSVDARNAEVGVNAARELLARIAEPARPVSVTRVEPRLVLRATTAAARRL